MRRFLFAVLLVIVVAAFGAIAWKVTYSPHYKATAMIQLMYNKPSYVYPEMMGAGEYEKFVATQKVLLRSPIILEKVAENPVLNHIPELSGSGNKADWIARHLEIEMPENSEIMTVSCRMLDPRSAQIIVESVVLAYIEYSNNELNNWHMKLTHQLNLELARKQQEAQLLQQEIRSKTERAAKNKGGIHTTADVIDVSFVQDQLRRVNEVMGLLHTRIVQLKTEQNAPNRVQLKQKPALPTRPEPLFCGN